MGLDMLTISKLAHHRNIETTRRHYDFFDTEKIVGRMNLGLAAAEQGRDTEEKKKITTISLQSDQ